MNVEAYFIRWCLESAENCNRGGKIVPIDSLGREGRNTYAALSEYYKETDVSEGTEFEAWLANTERNTKRKEEILSVIEAARKVDTSNAVYENIIQHYKQVYAATEIACAAESFLNGHSDYDIFNEIEQYTAYAKATDTDEEEIAPDSLDELLNETVGSHGLEWRLHELNLSCGPLRKGDFVIVAARIETGKTTFLCSEVTHMVLQGEGPVLWVNNEENSKKVKLRLYEAALGESKHWMLENKKQAEKALKQWENKLIVVEPSYIWEVEQLINQYKPCLIVFDVLDKVGGFKGDREDIIYGKLYRWARDVAKKHCPVIAVSQCDGSAEGRKYLLLSQLDGSRTAKQKEADAIIMIGKDTDNEYMRYISIPKNKLTGGNISKEHLRHGRFEVLIDPVRARFLSL